MKGLVIDPEKDGRKEIRGSEEDNSKRLINWILGPQDIPSEQFMGGLSTFEPGIVAPMHVHPDAEEINVVLEGEGEFYADDEVMSVKKGDWQFIPKGVAHSHKNTGSGPFTIVWVYSPPSKAVPQG